MQIAFCIYKKQHYLLYIHINILIITAIQIMIYFITFEI